MSSRYAPARPEETARSTYGCPGWSSTRNMARMFRSISLLVIRERGLPRLRKGLLSPLSTGFCLVLLPDDGLQADFPPFDGHDELVLLGQAEFLPLLFGDQDSALLVQGSGLHAHHYNPTLLHKSGGSDEVGARSSHRLGRLGARRLDDNPIRLHRVESVGSAQEPARLELGRDLLDRLVDVRGLPGPRAHDLATAEHEEDDLRLLDAVHEARELLRLVLDGARAEGDRDRVEVELGPEVRGGDDVLDLDLGVLLDRDAGRLDLLRDHRDRDPHALDALRARADDLAAAEQQDRGLRFLDPVDEAGELLRLVLGAAQGEGDRLEVELVPKGGRCDDVLDPVLGHGTTSGPGIAQTGALGGQPEACRALYGSVRPRAPSARRNGLGWRCWAARSFRSVVRAWAPP